ncbi:type VI secretion protein ImpB [Polymorphobacter sp. PAMC 29334]|uniref:Y-family DNA polymerase n=1 Tax=Polymorphobacter sp. PAMC 29334 TaxID=2862331 RepID=UPI001C77B486|nr:type VI secretion protein ImpB [Polymorphobacter sp. PAMC 29334]QYE34990.1 type VI secretion protein ImpB [Polymorphobacter sp. PAMC 29334]
MPESLPLRWLYLDLNSYFASVEQQLDPTLRGRPIAVAPVHTDSTSAIAASYEAKAFGIKTGTPIWEAKAKCRDLVVVPARHEEYVRFHHRIVAEVERHVPVTAVCSIDEVACRLCDNENGRAEVGDLARRIKAGIAANVGTELKSSIGIAPNRLLAKMAADMEKPDGLTVLDAECLDARLRALRPNDIPGVGKNMEKRLAAAGVVTMARILDLDAREARSVWGNVWGERLHWLLKGVDLPERETQRRTIGHSHVLGPDKRHPDRARLVARRLLMKAATRLRRMECRTGFVVLTVKGEKGEAVGGDGSRTPGLRWSHGQKLVAAHDSFTLLAVLDSLWLRMRAELAEQRYRQVSVTFLELTTAAETQLALFDAGPAVTPETEARRLALSAAIDRMNTRFGRDAVTVGHDSAGASRSSGPKIAFTRIPELAEFRE